MPSAVYLASVQTPELLGVQVHQHNTVVPVCYRPPDTTLREFDAALARLDEVLLDLPVPTPTIALMGDFNFPASVVSWSREDGALLPQVAGHQKVAFGAQGYIPGGGVRGGGREVPSVLQTDRWSQTVPRSGSSVKNCVG